MLTKLMQVNSAQEDIIRKQAAIIDELFILLTYYDSIESHEGLMTCIQDVADKTEELHR